MTIDGIDCEDEDTNLVLIQGLKTDDVCHNMLLV
jgi:hypothetical protein